MKIIVVLAIFTVAFGAFCFGAAAQSAFEPPSNLPPASFSGPQFVDGKGCIYIRAGSVGAETWVPRVTRDRKQICGFEPSFPSANAKAGTGLAPGVQVIEASSAPEKSIRPTTVPESLIVTQAASDAIGPDTRILPKHIYDRRKSQKPVKTPRGYRNAWQDGRLNLRRAEGTLRGREQMGQIWTNTVPRRLVLPD